MSNYPLTDEQFFLMKQLRITTPTIIRVLTVISSGWFSSLDVGLVLYPDKSDSVASRSAKNLISKIERLGFIHRTSSPHYRSRGVFLFSISASGSEFLNANS
jgi:hypothetical protein